MTPAPVACVSVVYGGETNLLRLQARSFARFLDPDLVSAIVLVLNDPREAALERWIRRWVLPEYGPLAPRVRLRRARDLSRVPRRDWLSQQALKLEVARDLPEAWYLLFDCKNHLIRPLDADRLFDPAGRPRHHTVSNRRVMPERFALSYREFGLPPPGIEAARLPPTTPSPMRTQLVRTLLDDCERRHREPFGIYFARTQQLTEFYLYDAWLTAQGVALDTLYALEPPPLVTLWRGTVQERARTLELLERLDDPWVYVFALHRLAFPVLEPVRARVHTLWRERGLVHDPREADAFLDDPVWTPRWHQRLRRQADSLLTHTSAEARERAWAATPHWLKQRINRRLDRRNAPPSE